MKQIFHIAKNELRSLFYSPIAWFLMIAFLVMCGYFYTGMMYPHAKMYSAGFKLNPDYKILANSSATTFFFQPFFTNILSVVYLFIPLLTMGVISREEDSGTFRLLYSSPVKLRQIVLGKFLALMAYNLVFILIIGIFILSGFFDIKELEYGPLLASVLGIYLLLCALSAIGFFMSSLTVYQVVAAIASFTLFFALTKISNLWQQYDFIRDLTWFLSINDRVEWMIKGLIRSKDVFYYLLIILLFVGFTLFKLKSRRETTPWFIRLGRYITLAAFVLLAGYVSAWPGLVGYWDTSSRKINTIRPETLRALNGLEDGILEVTLYTNLFDNISLYRNIGFPQNINRYRDMWEPYIRFKPDMKFRYAYYYAPLPGDSTLYKKFPGKSLRQIAGLMAKGLPQL